MNFSVYINIQSFYDLSDSKTFFDPRGFFLRGKSVGVAKGRGGLVGLIGVFIDK